jgi:hypothetical protein
MMVLLVVLVENIPPAAVNANHRAQVGHSPITDAVLQRAERLMRT